MVSAVGDVPLDPAVERAVGADQVVSRKYLHVPSGAMGEVFLGYFASAAPGVLGDREPHLPTVCLPAAGWTIVRQAEVGGAVRMEVTSGRERREVQFWHQTARRVIANPLWLRWYWVGGTLGDGPERFCVGADCVAGAGDEFGAGVDGWIGEVDEFRRQGQVMVRIFFALVMGLTVYGQALPDLTVASISTTNVTTDTQSLQVSGTLGVTVRNLGAPLATPFRVMAWEDRDGNGVLNAGVDVTLGSAGWTGTLATGADSVVVVPVGGVVLFRESDLCEGGFGGGGGGGG